MIELTHKPTVEAFLHHKDNADFWRLMPDKPDLPCHFCCLYESGCMMIIEPLAIKGLCGVHMACLKSARGKNAVNFAKRCFDLLKKKQQRIFARIQRDRREVIAMAKLSGMKEYNRSDAYVFLEAV